MPYVADPTGYGKPILTPEEEALLLAEAEAIPPPDTSMYAAPVEAQYQPGGDAYLPPYDAGAAYGAATGPSAYEYVPAPAPTDPYNTAPSGTYASDPIPTPAYTYDAAEPYGTSPSAIPEPEVTALPRFRSPGYAAAQRHAQAVPPPSRYNFAAAEPSLADRRLPMIDTAPISPTASVGRLLGLDPDDPNLDMANQLSRNLYDWTGDRLTESARGWGEMIGFAPEFVRQMVSAPLSLSTDAAVNIGGTFGIDPIQAARESWETIEDIAGPHGMGLRQAQSTADPVGRALGQARDALPTIASPLATAAATLRDRFGREEATTEDLLDVLNAPIATYDGEEPAPETLGAKSLLAGADVGASIRRNPPSDLNQMSAHALASVASNPVMPQPVRAEAGRLIGSTLAQQVAQQDQPWYQGGLDAARRGAQSIRSIDIPTPTLPSSTPDVSLPDVGLPSVSLPSLPVPSVAIPPPDAATPAMGTMPQEVATAAQEIPGRLAGSLESLPDLGMPTADFAQGLAGTKADPRTWTLPDLGGGTPATREAAGTAPNMTAQTAGMIGRTTTDEWRTIMKTDRDAWLSATKRTPVVINGVSQKLIESTDVPGLFLGYIDAKGTVVPVGGDVSGPEFIELVVANAAEAPAGWGDAVSADAVPSPDAATARDANAAKVAGSTASGAMLEDVAIPAPAVSGGSSRSSDGDYSRSSGRGSYGRGSGSYRNDDDYDREFTADDFLEAADGDRRKATMMARFANRKRRSGRSSEAEDGGGFWPGFPFNRPPSPIRQNILAALRESTART